MKTTALGAALLALSLTAGCSRETPPPADVTASTDQPEQVTVAWSIASGAKPSGFVVSRDGAPVAELPAGARSYVDATTTPGSVEAVRALDATSRTDGVALSWQAAAVHPGTSHGYAVAAIYPDDVIADSGLVRGARAAPVVTGYRLLRDGVELKLLTATATDFVDLGEVDTFVAPTGFTATVRTRADGVQLSWTAAGSEDGPAATYALETLSTQGSSAPSATASGHRAALAITYELSRDSGPWIAFGEVTSYLDREAPLGEIVATAKATPHVALAYIELSLSEGPTIIEPAVSSYALRVANQRADAPVLVATGARSTGAGLSIQWQRGPAAPTPIAYQDLPGVTGSPSYDLEADGSAASYRATLRTEGAQGISSATEGTANVYASLSAGTNATCGLRASDGKRLCWGIQNGVRFPADPSDASFRSITLGEAHGCGILEADGKVICWGYNGNEQAPPGPSTDAFASLGAGQEHTCGLRLDGRVTCWGTGTAAQVPPGPNASVFASITAGTNYTCALRASDDKLLCWGHSVVGEAPPGPSTTQYVSVDAGSLHTCAVRKADGEVECWGGVPGSSIPVELAGTKFSSVSAGEAHTCGIRQEDGKVHCWGDNSEGQAPLEPSTAAFSSVVTGFLHTCGLHAADGKVECWGYNSHGQAPQLPAQP